MEVPAPAAGVVKQRFLLICEPAADIGLAAVGATEVQGVHAAAAERDRPPATTCARCTPVDKAPLDFVVEFFQRSGHTEFPLPQGLGGAGGRGSQPANLE